MNEYRKRSRNKELRVAASSSAASVAGAIVLNRGEGAEVTLSAIGAGAVNQAIKAIAIARGMAAPKGDNLGCIPTFVDEEVDNKTKTCIKLRVIDVR